MKIVWVDGYNRETVADRLVAENIRNREEAETMLEALRAKGHEADWFVIKEDNQPLWRGMEELV